MPRLASHLLHLALFIADDRYRNTLDEDIITAAAQDQDPSDLHIALEVDDVTQKAIFEKSRAMGFEPYGPAELESLRSIYLRDPNGYIVEFTTKLENHDAVMDPETNHAREILDRWQAEKASF